MRDFFKRMMTLQFGCYGHRRVEPFSKRQILDPSKWKEFADYNSKFDENGKKLSKRVENTVGKGEIAHCEQFLLPQCFQKTCTADIVWERVKVIMIASSE